MQRNSGYRNWLRDVDHILIFEVQRGKGSEVQRFYILKHSQRFQPLERITLPQSKSPWLKPRAILYL